MKKYIAGQGFSFVDNGNDMTHKQFYLESIVYSDSDTTTLGNWKLDRVETYVLFLKYVDAETFKATLEAMIEDAFSNNVNVSLANDITVENVENGYNITLQFTIQG